MSRALIHALAVAATAGATTAIVWPIAAGLMLAVAVAAASLAVPLAAGQKDATRSGRVASGVGARDRPSARSIACHVMVVVAVGALAASHTARARDAILAPPLGLWFAAAHDDAAVGDTPTPVRGVLEEDAARTPSGAIRLMVWVTQVHDSGGWRSVPGRALLHVQGDLAAGAYGAWTAGRRIEAPASMRWPAVLQNPGGADPLVQRLRRAYVLTGTIKSAALVQVSPAPWWDEAAAAVRRHVRRAAGELFATHPTTGAIVTAILIGDRAGLDPTLTSRLVDAGTYHVVAISGGNVAIVTLVVVLALRHLVRSPRAMALGALAMVAVYGWIVAGDPSVQRAVTAACVWLTAEAAGLRAPPLRVLSLVALLVIALDPLIVIMPGAWLSFGATTGILICAERIARSVVGGTGVTTHSRTVARRAAAALVTLGAATLAAELMLLPIGAWAFSRVSLAGLLLNFAAIPAMAVIQIAGIVAVAFVDAWPIAARSASAAARVATIGLVDSAHLVDWVPWLAWRTPPPPAWVIAVYYAAVGILISGRGARASRAIAWTTAASTAVAIALAPGVRHRAPPAGVLRVTILDVGQGDASVVQFPSGQVLVVDAGASTESFDTGARVVTPALWALGAPRVDWVAFTHADSDHIGGIEAVVAEFAAREVWEGVPVLQDGRRAALREAADARGVVWRSLHRGDRWEVGGTIVDVVHPPPPDWERRQVRNDDSIVFRLRHGDLEVLLTGDVGIPVEGDLVRDDDRRAVRILKVAHHGSRGSSSAGFVRAYRPWAAVVSAGRNNPFGHPAPEVLARLDNVGTTTLRTDRDGAVMIETDGRVVSMRTWTGRRWRVSAAPRSPPA